MLKPLRPSVMVVASTPGYRCYCCHDTGIVVQQQTLIADCLPSDVAVKCTRCNAATNNLGESTKYLDSRISKEQCDALHTIRHQDWLDTVRQQGSNMKSAAVIHQQTSSLAAAKSMQQEAADEF